MINKKKIIAGIATGAVITCAYLGYKNIYFEETDNAYVQAHVAILSAKVPGLISDVLVDENQTVKKGQVLVRIDPRDYTNTLNQQKAQLGAADASITLAKKDFERATALFKDKANTAQDLDTAKSKYDQLVRQKEALEAQIAQSQLNLEYAEIKAPADGKIGKKTAEPGMVVGAGQALLSFMDSRDPWIVANFKETQIRKMKAGQAAEIEIDSIEGKIFSGVIESLSFGTGATFALIPPDNATGNFTKIVQRVPVRIKLDPKSLTGFEEKMVTGASAVVSVRVRGN